LVNFLSNSHFHDVVLALPPAQIHSYDSSDKKDKGNDPHHLPGSAAPPHATPDEATPDDATPDGATPDGATPDGATPDGATPDGVSSEVTSQTKAPLNAQVRLTSHHDNSRGQDSRHGSRLGNSRGHVNLSKDAQAVSGTIDVTDAGLHGPLSLPPRGSDN
jgi:hypothetical protein